MQAKWKVLVLVGMGLFTFLMLYSYYRSIYVVRKYESILIKTQKDFYEDPKSKILINPIDYKYKRIHLLNKFTRSNLSELNLVCVFDGNGCSPCIGREIKFINEIFDEFPNSVYAFYIGADVRDMKQYNCSFNFVKINSYDSLFEDYILSSKNTNFLVNSFGEILDIHRPEIGVEYKSELFFKRIKYFMKAINYKNEKCGN